jgi:Asp-tRNA(Asn)/Glu-tRNA(Gln) amidotransferase B subunit
MTKVLFVTLSLMKNPIYLAKKLDTTLKYESRIAQALMIALSDEPPSPSIYKEIANILIHFKIRRAKPSYIYYLATLRSLNIINAQICKHVAERCEQEDIHPLDIMLEEGLLEENDESNIKDVVSQVITNNEKAVEDYRKGRKAALGHLMGAAMKVLGKSADAKLVKGLIENELDILPAV